MPGAHGSANKSHACTDHLGMSCVKTLTADIRCLLKDSKREAFMTLKDEYFVAIKLRFVPKRLAFAAQVKIGLQDVLKISYIKTLCFIPLF